MKAQRKKDEKEKNKYFKNKSIGRVGRLKTQIRFIIVHKLTEDK